jgi:hypothetical protein
LLLLVDVNLAPRNRIRRHRIDVLLLFDVPAALSFGWSSGDPFPGHCHKRQSPGKILGHGLPNGLTTSSAASWSRAIPTAIGSNRETTLSSTKLGAVGPSPATLLDAAFVTCHTLRASSRLFAPPALSPAGFLVILCSRVVIPLLLGSLLAGLIAAHGFAEIAWLL